MSPIGPTSAKPAMVRIFAEWATGYPLWNEQGSQATDLALSNGFLSRFAAWNHRWGELASDCEHEDDDSWTTWEPALVWNAEGYVLAHELRRILPSDVELIYFDYVTGEDVVIEVVDDPA